MSLLNKRNISLRIYTLKQLKWADEMEDPNDTHVYFNSVINTKDIKLYHISFILNKPS